MKKILAVLLAAALLVLAALPALGAIPNRYLGDRAKPFSVTASDVAATVTLPAGKQGVFLVVTNDGTEDVYLALNLAATTTDGFVLKPNEEVQVPVALTSLGYVCDTGKTTLLRGWILYY